MKIKGPGGILYAKHAYNETIQIEGADFYITTDGGWVDWAAYASYNETLRLSISKGAGITALLLKCIEYGEPDQVRSNGKPIQHAWNETSGFCEISLTQSGECMVEVDWDLEKGMLTKIFISIVAISGSIIGLYLYYKKR